MRDQSGRRGTTEEGERKGEEGPPALVVASATKPHPPYPHIRKQHSVLQLRSIIIYMYSFLLCKTSYKNIQQQEEGAVTKTGLPMTVLGLQEDHINSQKLQYDCKYPEIYID